MSTATKEPEPKESKEAPKATTTAAPATTEATPAIPEPTAGQKAFEAYATERNWVSIKGEPIPRDYWQLDPPQLRDAWDAAAAAAQAFETP